LYSTSDPKEHKKPIPNFCKNEEAANTLPAVFQLEKRTDTNSTKIKFDSYTLLMKAVPDALSTTLHNENTKQVSYSSCLGTT